MEARKSPSLTDRSTEATVSILNGVRQINPFRRERSITGHQPPRHLFHKKKTTVEAGTRIEDDFQGVLGQHLRDLLAQRQGSRRSRPVSRKQHRVAREGRRRVQEGNAVTVPQDRQHPGTRSNGLPEPPVRRQTAPHSQQRRNPIRTFSRSLFVYLRIDRSHPSSLKRVSYPWTPASSYPGGKKKRKTQSKSAAATARQRLKHR